MKVELDDGNYEGMIVKLMKGSLEQKSNSLKKFIFLYENARSRIYLYERRITECLQLLLLMQQKDIATLTLNLLQKIIVNTSPDSQIFSIIKKKLLSKIVINLGSVEITTRKISHRCILQYIRKSKDYDSIIISYIKTGIQQTENIHLKIKSINSLHSLIMAQPKYFLHGVVSSQILLEQMIYASYQKQYIQIRRASILCLLQVLRLDGSEKTLKIICSPAQKQLFQLKLENTELSSLLEIIMRYKNSSQQKQKIQSEIESVPSPKFMSINNEDDPKIESVDDNQEQKIDKIADAQLKVYNDVSYAQQFLKKLQKNQSWQLSQIKQFAPYLEKYLVDQSIKLFSISKKIVQVIFDSECQQQRQYYVVLVPCVVNGIGNKRFIVRKNLDKLVRQYIKNHTEIWVQNFIQRFSQTQNQKIKQILIELFLHAYRTSPEFYQPTNRTFSVMEKQIKDVHSNLKWKAVDCLITVIQKQAKNQKMKQEMMNTLSPQVYNKIMRKMNKTQNSLGSNPGSVQPLSPTQRIKRKQRRNIRLTTDEPIISIQKSNQKDIRKDNISQQKNTNQILSYLERDRKTRKSQADIDFKIKKLKQQKQSIKKLPQLRRGKYSNIVSSKIQANNESPVKKSIGQKSIMYVDKQNLPEIPEPKSQLEKALTMMKDSSWNTQFQSINCIRSIIQNHKQLITEQYFVAIITQLLQCLNNMRSGVSKIALICLGQLLRKFHRRSHQFTEQIVNTLVKKSITTSEFIQQQIRRCISISVDELDPNKIINSLNSLKENSKGSQIKVSILVMIDTICKNQKIYKKQLEWIWNALIYFHQDPSLQVKLESRKVAKGLIEIHREWKNDITGLKPYTLQKIDKIIKGLLGANNLNGPQSNDSAWLESQNKQLGKLISSKVMTSKYFASQYSKFQQQDKIYNSKKNFKQRSRLLSGIFASAFQYPIQFQANTNAKKYIAVALDHLDQKNPGLLLNSLGLFNKSIDVFPGLIEQCLSSVFQKIIPLLELKKVQIGQSANKFLSKIFQKLDKIKCCKQLIKSSVAPSLTIKARMQSLNQAYIIMRWQKSQEQQQKFQALQPLLLKVLNKLGTEQISSQNIKEGKIKQIIVLCCRKFGNDFEQKIQSNQKLAQILSSNNDKSGEPTVKSK